MIQSAALSDPGRKRQVNQDYYIVHQQCQLYVLADGGSGGGEEAAKLTVSTIHSFIHLAEHKAEVTWPFGDLQGSF